MERSESVPMVLKITGVLKKFRVKDDGTAWTEEEIEAGLADDHLIETIELEDEVWA